MTILEGEELTNCEITLDWDNITNAELERRINFVTSFQIVEKVFHRMSALKGHHIKVILNKTITFSEIMRLRKMWKDDGQRMVLDILRTSQPRMVLWNHKYLGLEKFSATQWEEKYNRKWRMYHIYG